MDVLLIILIIIFLILIAISLRRLVFPPLVLGAGLINAAGMWDDRVIFGASDRRGISDALGAGDDPVCIKTDELMEKFLTDRFTPELASTMEQLASDIKYDIDELTSKKLSSLKSSALDTAVAKLLLDSMLQFYIHENHPNTISEKAIKESIKKLEQVADRNTCFRGDRIRRVASLLQDVLKGKSPAKSEHQSKLEYFRKYQVSTIAGTKPVSECDDLRDELSRKTIELRQKNEEIERLKLRSGNTSSLTSNLTTTLLDECNRERRFLQEKVYQLTRDIENLKIRGPVTDPTELSALRDRIRDLQAENSRLSTQYSQIAKEYSETSRQLRNCEENLASVLNSTPDLINQEVNKQVQRLADEARANAII